MSRWDSTFERSEATSGVREARRADWADWRAGSGRSSKCWGIVSTAERASDGHHRESQCEAKEDEFGTRNAHIRALSVAPLPDAGSH